MMNPVPVYKYVKANPLIKLNVNDKVYVVNGFTFLSNQYGVTRKDCLRDINFEDLCETKYVTSALFLDMNEGLPKNEHNYRVGNSYKDLSSINFDTLKNAKSLVNTEQP